MAEVQFYKVNALPATLCPNSWYVVINGDFAETYVTTNNGIPKLVGNSTMIDEVVSNYITSYSNIQGVANIAARNALAPTTPTLAYVIDAHSDPTVGSGSATYVWFSGAWYKISNNNYVESVTGLNTDNTDPLNPIVNISVDGTTITGAGTPANPLVSNASIGPKGDTGSTGPQGSQGQQGIQGPQGIAGAHGIAGSIGPSGPQGFQGIAGPLGPQGPQGLSAYQVWLLQGGIGDVNAYLLSLKGVKGDQGPAGATGAQGAIGIRGDTGTQGPQGFQGLSGPPGAQGNDGAIGSAGPAGPQGIQGIQGVMGDDGAQGPAGTSVTIKGSVATSGDLSSITGAAVGDGYIATDTGHLWVWNGTTFVDVGKIQGPPGANGSPGPTGATGPAGSTGPAGPEGPEGPEGPGGSITIYGEYSTQQDAIDAGLTRGQVYRLPYLDENRRLAIVEDPEPDATFYFGDTTIPMTTIDIVAGQPGTAAHNATAVVNYTNTSDQYLWYAERVTENIKDSWYNTALNNGGIGPSDLFLTPTIIDGIWRLYVSAYATEFTGSCQFRSTETGGDTTTFVSGLNTDNTDPTHPIVRISVDGTTITGAGTPASPLVSHSSGGSYTLPTASATVLGGIKVGSGLLIASSVLSTDTANGTYTPTYTNIANISGAIPRQCQYMRVGKVVTVSGVIQGITTTTTGISTLSLTLPITSAFNQSYNAGGTGAGITNATMYSMVINSRSGTNTVGISFISDSAIVAVGVDIQFSFTYLII